MIENKSVRRRRNLWAHRKFFRLTMETQGPPARIMFGLEPSYQSRKALNSHRTDFHMIHCEKITRSPFPSSSQPPVSRCRSLASSSPCSNARRCLYFGSCLHNMPLKSYHSLRRGWNPALYSREYSSLGQHQWLRYIREIRSNCPSCHER
jgi:hypothetical protein